MCFTRIASRVLTGSMTIVMVPAFVFGVDAHAAKKGDSTSNSAVAGTKQKTSGANTSVSAASAQLAAIVPQQRMGLPLLGLTPGQIEAFNLGKIQYSHPLAESEGLGPIFNKNNCGNCHNNPAGGTGTQEVTRFGFAGKDGFDPLDHLGGSLLQVSAIADGDCLEVIPVESNHQINRVTNGALAFGLVEAIPDADIYANELNPPHPSVSGRVNWVEAFEDPPASPLRAGRFGWKAQVATVLTFSADAALNEMGLTNRFILTENDPNGINPPDLGSPDFCDTVADPEDNLSLGNGVNKEFIDVVTDFQRYLAPPPQTPKNGMSGEAVFNSAALRCNACHVRTFTTANDPGLEDAIRNQTFHPYSDWLLHDMGTLGDGIRQGDAGEAEMKTAPLWGLGRPDRAMLHDNRASDGPFAQRIEDAIFWHNTGEALGIADAYFALPQADKDSLIAFLASLGRREFDHTGDDFVLLEDFDVFRSCYGSSGYSPDDECAISDIDQDGDVDGVDFNAFLLVYDGQRRDCNSNGVWDLVEIINGTGIDADFDGTLDSCQPTCDADINGTHGADMDDLLTLLSTWGPCSPAPSPCAADLDANDVVDIMDLLATIGGWGECPLPN